MQFSYLLLYKINFFWSVFFAEQVATKAILKRLLEKVSHLLICI